MQFGLSFNSTQFDLFLIQSYSIFIAVQFNLVYLCINFTSAFYQFIQFILIHSN